MEDPGMDGEWMAVCDIGDIVPDTGVCAQVGGEQVAIFRVGSGEIYAIDNIDPHSQAAVLSRGLVGSVGERVVVASPIYKQHFDLQSGQCLESSEHAVRTWPIRLQGERVWVRRDSR